MQFIRISNINDNNFNEFWQIYQSSFPENEKRFLNEQERIFKNSLYFANIIKTKEIIGILCFWMINEYYFLEHFAIKKEKRGENFGSIALENFIKNKQNIILEIDLINDEISQKRLNFYDKFGFYKNDFKHFQAPFRKNSPPVELILLSLKPLSKAKYENFYQNMLEILDFNKS